MPSTAGAALGVLPVRPAAFTLKGKAVERARHNTGSGVQAAANPQQSAKLLPNPRFRQIMSLVGKDLSKLPEWQRLILERKQQVQLDLSLPNSHSKLSWRHLILVLALFCKVKCFQKLASDIIRSHKTQELYVAMTCLLLAPKTMIDLDDLSRNNI